MPRAPLAALALALALPLAAAGCGDDMEKSTGSATVDASKPVVVDGDEYSFKPGTITVRAAAGSPGGGNVPVRFELRNIGSLPHDIHVRRGDEELGGTDAVGGGETAEGTVELAPGDYEIYCSIGDHADLGMTGDLKIE